MKLLFLNNYHYLRGGSERVFFGEMEILQARGHTVYSFARKHPHDLPAKFESFFPQHLETESIHFSFDAIRTVKEIIYSKESKTSLKSIINRYPPDLAHAHNIYGRLTTSVLDLLNNEGISAVLTLHDYKLICPSYKLMKDNRICEDCKGNKFYKAVVNKCHKNSLTASAVYAIESYFNTWFGKYSKNVAYFISPSRFLRSKLTEFGWPESKIEYVPNYLVTSKFEPSYEAGKYLLYLGRLSGEKGIETLIRAYNRISPLHVKMLIVGEGPEEKKLKALAGGSGDVIFPGYLSGEELSQVTRESLAVVVPSEWYENAPISILEAMAYGKPVIGSNIGGIPEMVDHGVTGYLFEPGNVADLASKIELLLSLPPNRLAEMGRAAREKVEREYNEEIHYSKLMEVYKKALS